MREARPRPTLPSPAFPPWTTSPYSLGFPSPISPPPPFTLACIDGSPSPLSPSAHPPLPVLDAIFRSNKLTRNPCGETSLQHDVQRANKGVFSGRLTQLSTIHAFPNDGHPVFLIDNSIIYCFLLDIRRVTRCREEFRCALSSLTPLRRLHIPLW